MERLQKFLAGAGVSSRRKAEEMIANGRVRVNNAVVTELGTKIDPARDLVTVDGKPIHAREEERYYLLYKPSGCVTTLSDPQGRPTAASYLAGVKERVFPVGRLDYDAEGAVLFTTDGELANRLAHPRYGHQRVYLAKVKPPQGDADTALLEALARMKKGVRLEDGPAKALEAVVHEEAEKNVWIRVVVGEGRNHLVKRLCEAVGLPVLRLFRPEFGGVSVAGLRPGRWRPLEADEVRTMKRHGGLEAGGDEAPVSLARTPLPKAARRHGHGPPPPPSRDGKDAPAREPAARGGRAPFAARAGAAAGRSEPPSAAAPFRKLVQGRGAPTKKASPGARKGPEGGARGGRPSGKTRAGARGPRGGGGRR